MKKFLVKICVYAIGCTLLLNLIAFVANYFLGKSVFYKSNYVENYFAGPQQFDYAIFGSSRGLTSLNSIQIDSALGTHGVNLSCDDTDLKTHILMLRHAYAAGHNIKTAILTLDTSNFTSSPKSTSNNDYRFASYIGRDYVYEHFEKYEPGFIPPIQSSRFFPLTAYSYYNLELFYPGLLAMVQPNKRNRFDKMGNYSYPNSKKINPDRKWKDDSSDSLNNPLINEFLEVASTNDTQVVIYIAPYYHNRVNLTDTQNVQIINHAEILDDSAQFYDYIHVNKNGRSSATSAFIADSKQFLQRKKS